MDQEIQYEIDYIAVGDESRGGDAICLRFGHLSDPVNQTVVVIDGGFKDSGKALVHHIQNFYQTDKVDLIIATHPDMDHTSGLTEVIENLKVGQLAMHLPWEHAGDIKDYFKSKTLSVSGLGDKLEKAVQNVSDLEDLARKRGISIVEPFQGMEGFGGKLLILGPSQEYYEELVPHFRDTPEAKSAIGSTLQKVFSDIVHWVEDRFDIDLLDDDNDTTAPENNTSVIALWRFGEHKILLTGDAGKTALHNAVYFANSKNINLQDLKLFHVPHHGSKRNISSSLLNHIGANCAYISAPANSTKHPSKKVTNGLLKRGMKVFPTKGKHICYSHGAPARVGWTPIESEKFHNRVEE